MCDLCRVQCVNQNSFHCTTWCKAPQSLSWGLASCTPRPVQHVTAPVRVPSRSAVHASSYKQPRSSTVTWQEPATFSLALCSLLLYKSMTAPQVFNDDRGLQFVTAVTLCRQLFCTVLNVIYLMKSEAVDRCWCNTNLVMHLS